MLRNEVEKDVDPFIRGEGRVVLLVRAIGVGEASKDLGHAFHSTQASTLPRPDQPIKTALSDVMVRARESRTL